MQVQVYGYQSLGHNIVFKWHHAFQIGEVLPIVDVQKKYPTTHTEQSKIVKDSALYSHAPHNDVSVNDGPHIQWWSHNIIIYYNIYHCVTIAYSIQYNNMLYRFVD
jgi:hypothetical protein